MDVHMCFYFLVIFLTNVYDDLNLNLECLFLRHTFNGKHMTIIIGVKILRVKENKYFVYSLKLLV